MTSVLCTSFIIAILIIGTSHALPWSRSLPSGTRAGFPIDVAHLVVAQGSGNNTLFAFHIHDGTPAWTLDVPEPIYPHAVVPLGQEGQQSPADKDHNIIATFQGQTKMYGVDISRGILLWTVGSLSTPVFLPTALGQQFGIMTGVYVNESFPRCLGGFDAAYGASLWLDCTHQLCAQTLTDGSALPVMVTMRSFMGCFESERDASVSLVIERLLDDLHFPPRVFDFYPNTIIMTDSVNFLAHDFSNGGDGGEQSNNKMTKKHVLQHGGGDDQPFRVTFAVSGWDAERKTYVGPASLVNVIAQAGVIDWKVTIHSLQVINPLIFLEHSVNDPHNRHEMTVSDGTNYVAAISGVNGRLLWNYSIPKTFTGGIIGSTTHEKKKEEKASLKQQSSTSTPDVLGPVTNWLQTDVHMIFSQQVVSSAADEIRRSNAMMQKGEGGPAAEYWKRKGGDPRLRRGDNKVDEVNDLSSSMSTTDVVTVLDVTSGRLLVSEGVSSPISAPFTAHNFILYIPSNYEVAALNLTNWDMRDLYLTHSPVLVLRKAQDDDRLVFGTSTTVFSFPLL